MGSRNGWGSEDSNFLFVTVWYFGCSNYPGLGIRLRVISRGIRLYELSFVPLKLFRTIKLQKYFCKQPSVTFAWRLFNNSRIKYIFVPGNIKKDDKSPFLRGFTPISTQKNGTHIFLLSKNNSLGGRSSPRKLLFCVVYCMSETFNESKI